MYLGGGIETVDYFCHRVDGFVGLTVKPTFVIELPEDFDEAVFFFSSGVGFQLDICFSITQELITFFYVL